MPRGLPGGAWVVLELTGTLRAYAPQISHVQIFLKTLTAGRKLLDYIKNIKKIGGHRTRFGDKAYNRP